MIDLDLQWEIVEKKKQKQICKTVKANKQTIVRVKDIYVLMLKKNILYICNIKKKKEKRNETVQYISKTLESIQNIMFVFVIETMPIKSWNGKINQQ